MIEFRNVSYTYPSGTCALSDVSLHIAEGEFACVLGGNGSGKSTLAKHANALLAPSQGSVRVCGMDTRDAANVYAIRAAAGMVFQNPEDQLVATPVENDVAFGPENMGVEPAEIRRRVADALERVGLGGFEKRDTASLSGGQKQRLAIAGALAMHPRILILDEASAMLDPLGRTELMRICRDLHSQGMTVVMVTHSMEEASCAQKVLVMRDGRLAAQGSPETILRDRKLLAGLALKPPFPVSLAWELRERGIPVEPELDPCRLARQLKALKEASCSR